MPGPGRFKTYFTASMTLKGATAAVIESHAYEYRADCGAPVSCKVLDVLKEAQLRSQLPAMFAELLDDVGNMYSGSSLPHVSFASEQLNVSAVHGQSAKWHSPQPGKHQLQLPALDIAPIADQLTFPSPPKAVKCEIQLRIAVAATQHNAASEVATTFAIGIKPGS